MIGRNLRKIRIRCLNLSTGNLWRQLAVAGSSGDGCRRHEVVVKVQRPGIQEQIEIDLEILEDFVSLLVKHTRYGEFYDFAGMLHELKESLNRELDFRREGENADRFRRNLSKEPKISVPDIRWVYTTTRVLTMSYVDGMRITQTQALKEAGIDCRETGHTPGAQPDQPDLTRWLFSCGSPPRQSWRSSRTERLSIWIWA